MRRIELTAWGMKCTVEIGRSPDEAAIRAQFQENNNYFEGDYETWESALKNTGGYNQHSILQKSIDATRRVINGEAAYERDTVTFQRHAYSHPLLACLLYVASCNMGQLRVMDFGGALGSTYRQHRPALKHLPDLKWGVVEQPHYVEAGRVEFVHDELDFYASMDQCTAAISPNLGLMSATLQYLENPHAHLDAFLSRGMQYIVLDKTLAHDQGRDRLVIQHVPPQIYWASYPVWLLGSSRLEACFSKHGYKVIDRYDPYPGSSVDVDDFSARYTSWFLEKTI